jgi:hypothetical protein
VIRRSTRSGQNRDPFEAERQGYVWPCSTREAQSIEDRADLGRRFTDALPRHDLPSADRVLCLVCYDDRLIAVGVLERGDFVTTLRRRISLRHLRRVDAQAPEIVGACSSQVRSRVASYLTTGGRIPPAPWRAILVAMRAAAPDVALDLQDLPLYVRPTLSLGERASMLLAEERDAVSVALEIAAARRPSQRLR